MIIIKIVIIALEINHNNTIVKDYNKLNNMNDDNNNNNIEP